MPSSPSLTMSSSIHGGSTHREEAVHGFKRLSPRRSRRASMCGVSNHSTSSGSNRNIAPEQHHGNCLQHCRNLSQRSSQRSRRMSLSSLDALDLDSEHSSPAEQPFRPDLQRRGSLRQCMGESARRLMRNSSRMLGLGDDASGHVRYDKMQKEENQRNRNSRKRFLQSRDENPNTFDTTECTADMTQSHTISSSSSEAGAEYEAMVILDSLDEHIQDLNERKNMLQEQMQSNLDLAVARFEAGSRGTMVAMRAAMKKKSWRAMTVATRFQLIELRKTVQQELDRLRSQLSNGNEVVQLTVDLNEIQHSITSAMDQLDTAQCPLPSDDLLQSQLEKMVGRGGANI